MIKSISLNPQQTAAKNKICKGESNFVATEPCKLLTDKQYESQLVGCINAASDYNLISRVIVMLGTFLRTEKANNISVKESKLIKTLIAGGAV